jgi:hypothetical protein
MAILLKKPIIKRKVFFSFNFEVDFWRTQQIRQIGTIEGNSVITVNKWEEIKKKGDSAIKKWIDENLENKSCLIVLIGENTADRKWIDYEITKAWKDKKGILGIRIHNLENQKGNQSKSGKNPFIDFALCGGKVKLSSIIKIKNPPQLTGKGVYSHINANLKDWIEEAIKIRKEFVCPK